MPPKQRIGPGPIGTSVAANMEHLRRALGLSYVEVSRRLEALGRPIAPLGLTRIRDLQRRVDVDDLVAIARALGVKPTDLLLPTPAASATERDYAVPLEEALRRAVLKQLPTPTQDRQESPHSIIGPARLKLRGKLDGRPIEIDLDPLFESFEGPPSEQETDDGDD